MRQVMIAAVIVALLAGAAGGVRLWKERGASSQTDIAALPPLTVTPRASRYGEHWSEIFVVDLGAPGVQLFASGSSSSAFFDLDNDGFAELGGWPARDDGILAIDIDGDGRITNHAELLGGGDRAGFAALSWLDSDRNGTIDQSDRHYHRLYVWRDSNGDGVSTTAELIPLGKSSIRIIPLRGRPARETLAGHQVIMRGPIYISGQERDMIAVRLRYDNTISRDDRPLDGIDNTVLQQPDLRGYGRLPNLYRAMARDPELRQMVDAFRATGMSELLDPNGHVEDRVRDIMYRWAKVEDMSQTARGMPDSRMLEWLEEFRDEDYRQNGPQGSSTPTPDMHGRLIARFDRQKHLMAGKLLAQTQVGAIFGGLRYNAARDVLEGFRAIDTQRLAQAKWSAERAEQPADVWRVLALVVNVMGESALTTADRTLIASMLSSTAPGVTLESLLGDIRKSDALANQPLPLTAPAQGTPTTAQPVTVPRANTPGVVPVVTQPRSVPANSNGLPPAVPLQGRGGLPPSTPLQ